MLVRFQHITSRWTKFSRGAPHSAKYAAVPMSLDLPLPALPKKALRVVHFHCVGADEKEGFILLEASEIPDPAGLSSLYSEPVTLKFESCQLAMEYKGGVWGTAPTADDPHHLHAPALRPGSPRVQRSLQL